MQQNTIGLDLEQSPPVRRFSTDDYQESERLEVWQELFARKIAGADVTPQSEAPFFASVLARSLPGLRLMAIEHTPLNSARTRAHLADGDDAIVIAIPNARTIGGQFGRDVVLDAGDAFVMTTTDPCTHAVSARTNLVGLKLAPAILQPLLQGRSAPPFGRIPRQNEPLRLLRRFLRTLWEEPLARPELQKAVASQIYDLVALALGANDEAAECAKAGGLAAARLNEAKAYALANLRRPTLSLDEIAARQGVSARYLRMVFERDGVTFSQFVRTHRLELAYRMLSSARFARLSISSIAFDCGFGDLSNFNHAFRARYGAAPSDVRAQSDRGSPADDPARRNRVDQD
jgi:AraC-like DNA-binding protein